MKKGSTKTLFVLHFEGISAVKFIVAQDEQGLLEQYSWLVALASGTHTFPKRQRHNPDAALRTIKKYIEGLIAEGSIEVCLDQWWWGIREKIFYNGVVTWKSYKVGHKEIKFLQRLGLLQK